MSATRVTHIEFKARRMAGGPRPEALREAPRPLYPPPYLADLAVQQLAALHGNEFTSLLSLNDAQRHTRGVRSAEGCCIINALPEGDAVSEGLFYFGRDKDGYILARPRAPIADWPTSKGRTLPIRLTRWLIEAPAGTVVRHACDQPACIRISHLSVGTQSENLADAVKRCRRRKLSDLNTRSTPAPRGPAAWAVASSPRTEFRRGLAPLTAFGALPTSPYASPSKLARKRARMSAESERGGCHEVEDG